MMTLPSSLLRYRPGGTLPLSAPRPPPPDMAIAAPLVSGNMRRNERRVPMAGEGRSEGRAVTSKCVSSRKVHDGQV